MFADRRGAEVRRTGQPGRREGDPVTLDNRDALIEQAAEAIYFAGATHVAGPGADPMPPGWDELSARDKGYAYAMARAALDVVLAASPPTTKPAPEDALSLLRRLRQWDHLDGAGDGPYWRGEIDRVLAASPPPTTPARDALIEQAARALHFARGSYEAQAEAVVDVVLAAGLPGDWQARIEALPAPSVYRANGMITTDSALVRRADVLAALTPPTEDELSTQDC